MAYDALNNLIDAYIYRNGIQAITGQILNGVLKQMVAQLGGGYNLMGVAIPATTPATNDEPLAYFAATAGEYTDFGGITLAAGEIAVLQTSGDGTWAKQTIYNVPTGTADLENTANFITNAVTDLVNYYTKTEIDALPNGEDIDFDEDGKLQFANRVYNAQQPNGMGYKILRKDATFASQVTDTNTIYEIRYNFTLEDDELVTIPSGCELRFNGGSISGGVLNLNNALLSGEVNITSEPDMDETDEFVEGYKPRNLFLPVSWFGAKGDGSNDDAPALRRCIKWLHKEGATLEFHPGTYILGDGVQDLVNDPNMTIHTGYSYDPDSAVLTGEWTGIEDRAGYIAEHPANIGRDISLVFFKFSNLKINGRGSIVKSHSGNGYCRHNRLFFFIGCSHLSVSDLTIDGNRENRQNALGNLDDYSFGTIVPNGAIVLLLDSYKDILDRQNTWAGGVGTRDISSGYRGVGNFDFCYCQDVSIYNVMTENSLMDNISIMGDSSIHSVRFKISNSVARHSTRHNLTLGGTRFSEFKECVFEYAGLEQDGETILMSSASANIDSEGEYDGNDGNRFIGNIFGKTAQLGFVVTNNTKYNLITQNLFKDGSEGILAVFNNGCFKNEVSWNTFYCPGLPIMQEGSNIHHNTVYLSDYTGQFASLITTYEPDFVYGKRNDGKSSILPSIFSNNVIECSYTQQPSSAATYFMRVTGNIEMENNVFKNFHASVAALSLGVRKYVNNILITDTETYSWITALTSLRNYESPDGAIEIRDNRDDSAYIFCRKVTDSYRDFTIRMTQTSDLWIRLTAGLFDFKIVTLYKASEFFYRNTSSGWAGVRMTKKDSIGSPTGFVGYYHWQDLPVIYLPRTEGGTIKEIHIRIYSSSSKYANDLEILTSQPTISAYRQAPLILTGGATAERPSASLVGSGFVFYDSTLGKAIISNGTDWVNMDGTVLS